MKFGGTSVADIDRIRNAARHVRREVNAGHQVAVVVSAMAGVTNRLVEQVRQISSMHDAREYDAVVASGEQVTAGLLALALQALGVPSRSFQGWQLPLRTDSMHGRARIESPPCGPLRRGEPLVDFDTHTGQWADRSLLQQVAHEQEAR